MAKERTKRQLMTAGATFAIALSIGFVMQYGDAVAGRVGQDAPVGGPDARLDPEADIIPVAANVAVPVTLGSPEAPRFQAARALPEATPFGANLSDIDTPSLVVPAAADAAIEDVMQEVAPELTPTISAPAVVAELSCDTTLTVTESSLAMVRLELMNPCRPDTVVAIHHEGMMFNEITDADGALSIDVPVLSTEAFFIAAYDDGEGAVAMTNVMSLALYDRAALQWQGEDDVQLHALEYGANYGEDGHIWNGAQADPTQAIAGFGGFLTVLGNPNVPNALLAEVYTFPTGIALQAGEIALSVEAEITNRNCGREVAAQSIQVIPGQDPEAVDLVMTLPGCDAVGEFLVLKNMFEDLTLASR